MVSCTVNGAGHASASLTAFEGRSDLIRMEFSIELRGARITMAKNRLYDVKGMPLRD